MGHIHNERYETIVENMRLFKGRFICAYMPCYGLVKIEDTILKLSGYEGSFYHFPPEEIDTVVVKYIREKFYTEGFGCPKEELTEKEIFKMLTEE